MDLGLVLCFLFLNFFMKMCCLGSGARIMNTEQLKGLIELDHNVKRLDPRVRADVLHLHSMDHNGADGIRKERLHPMDDHITLHVREAHNARHGIRHARQSSHMHHMDSSLLVFFTMKDLVVGKKMPIYFPKRDPSTSPHFLTREEAESIPFSLKELPNLLKFFSFSAGSPQAKAMEDTLTECQTESIKGEIKHCATSLESMLDFSRSILGTEIQLEVHSTVHLSNSSTLLQNYTIQEPTTRVPAPKMVACHTMPYPFAIFYCHYQESESRVYKVLLHGENGDRVEAVAVCHMDTSQWSRNHVSFGVLGIEPGTIPVCHYFPADNLVWVPSHK